MNELTTLVFQGHQVRMIVRDGEPWWVARDVCGAIGIANYRDAVSRLDDDEKDAVGITDAIGRTQETTIVNEAGLYRIILGARLKRDGSPESEERNARVTAFKRWVTHEVIPSIRRTGTYIAPGAAPSQAQLALVMAQALVEQERRLAAVENRLGAIEARQQQAEQQLQALPEPTGPVADVSTRALLNRLIRAYSLETGVPHNVLWRRLYMEFRDRYHVDLVARATKSRSPLDVAESLGHMQTLYNLAATLFRRVS